MAEILVVPSQRPFQILKRCKRNTCWALSPFSFSLPIAISFSDRHAQINIYVKLGIPKRFIIKVSNNLKPGTSKSFGRTLLSVLSRVQLLLYLTQVAPAL